MTKKTQIRSKKISSKKNSLQKTFPWWKGSTIYQIYPRSFMDTNGDGVGDLAGIAEKLDYIAKLGVDGIWISPFFLSPMKDFGYDVSDYCAVDPLFGKLTDFKKIITKARSLNLKIIIDQVLSHTSDQHPWFKESRQSRKNPKADWFVWADPKPAGEPPNNWLSIFGGTAWQWDTRRQQYYLHNFLKEQPDLNFHNPEVRKALLKTMEFWLKLGVDGFRLDTVNFYYHSRNLKDNPGKSAKEKAKLNSVNPYDFQKHLYDKSQPENIGFLKDIRKLLDKYSKPGREIMSVGEVGDDDPIQVTADYTRGSNRLHSCYSFFFLGHDFSASHFKEGIESFEKKAKDGWAFWPFSNHDVERVATRWGKHFSGITAEQRRQLTKMLLSLQITLRGSTCLYQGEELGFPEAVVPFELFQDPYGIEMYPEYPGRDGCRTPMVWKSKAKQGGFSTTTPWLPISHQHKQVAVDVQEKDPQSMLHFTREILKFRQENHVLKWGSIGVLSTPKQIQENILILERKMAGASPIYGVFSLNQTQKQIPVSAFSEWGQPIFSRRIQTVKNKWVLNSFGFGFFQPKDTLGK